MKKTLLRLFSLLMTALMLCACGSGKTDGETDKLPVVESDSKTSGTAEEGCTEITMLSISAMPSLKDAVAQFNKNNDKYNVVFEEILPYDENYSDAQWDAAVTKLNTVIMSDDRPDILDLTELPVEFYYRKGLLENLFPLLENDSELKKEDFFWNVFEAMSIDGGLPYISDSVYVKTLAVPEDLTGGKKAWSVGDVSSLLNSQGRYYVGNLDGLGFILNTLQADKAFLDSAAGTCNFNTPQFTELLELAKEIEKSYQLCTESKDFEPYSISNEGIMTAAEIRSKQDYYENKLCFVGIPGGESSGNFIACPMSQLAISASSENKTGAWEFLKSFLSEEHMRHAMALGDSAIGIPINRAAFQAVGENAVKGKDSWCEFYGCKPVKEDVAMAETLMENVNVCSLIDGRLHQILSQECDSFFSNLQTAEETAERIQNTVSLYLSEQK